MNEVEELEQTPKDNAERSRKGLESGLTGKWLMRKTDAEAKQLRNKPRTTSPRKMRSMQQQIRHDATLRQHLVLLPSLTLSLNIPST